MDKFNDRSYKDLFSFPRMVEDLLRSFVKHDFVDHVDFSTLKKVNATFVSEEFRQRESDVIWEVEALGTKAYIYFLIEFQSSVDRFMALRMLGYVLMFYQDLLKQRRLRRLPPVFPLVLYNGDAKWTAPQYLEELIHLSLPELGAFVPKFYYYKIAENEFSRESLNRMDNLVARMFMLETGKIDELPDIIFEILKVLRTQVEPDLRRDFGLWIRGVLRKKHLDVDVNALDEMEVRPMLLTRLNKFENDARRQGREEGLKDGRVEGLRCALAAGLEARFGAGETYLRERIAVIEDATRLEKLAVALAVAPDLATFLRELDPQPPAE